MTSSALVIAGASLRGTLRDRVARFFFFVLPFAVTILVGLVLGGYAGAERVGVLDQGAPDVAAAIDHDPHLDAIAYHDADALRRAVQRADVALGVIVRPPEATRASRSWSTPPGRTRCRLVPR